METATIGSIVTSATGAMTTLVTWTVDTVTTNPMLAIFFVTGLIGMGIGVVSRLKRV